MGDKTIIITNERNTVTITLNRPKQMNAINGQIYDELSAALEVVENNDNAKCVIITGAGRAFCSGYDLNSRFFKGHGPGDPVGTKRGVLEAGQLLVKLSKFSKPIIAAVNGYAIGGGFSLALASDFIVASEKAQFSDGHTNLATVPDCGLTHFLPRLVGTSKALKVVLSGQIIDAKEAKQMGLVTEIVAPEKLGSAASELAESLTNDPVGLIKLIKGLIYQGAVLDLESTVENEGEAQAMRCSIEECREVAEKFVTKFKPKG